MNGKTLLAAACLISLACGYIAGKAGRSSEAETGSSPSQQTSTDRPHARESRPRGTGDNALLDSILGGRPIAEIPAAELAALIAKLSKYDPNIDPLTRAKQSYQLQLLLAKLSASDLAAIASAADPETKKSSTFTYVISALAAKDADRALDWLSTQESNPGLLATVISAIAKDDPQAAADLLQNAILDGNIEGYKIWSATYGVSQAMAKLGVDPLLSFIDSLPRQQQSNVANNVIQQIPEGERLRFLDEIRLRNQDNRFSGMSIDNLFSNILSTEETAAKEWFSKLPDGEEKNSLRIATAENLIERGEKEAAATWMREALAAAPGKEKETLTQVIMSMSYNNSGDISVFAKLLPEGTEFTAKDLENYAENSLYNGTGSLIALASAIKDPGEQARLLATTLEKISPTNSNSQNFNANDFAILSHKIAAMGFTGENATLVNNALEAARSGRVLPPDKD